MFRRIEALQLHRNILQRKSIALLVARGGVMGHECVCDSNNYM